MSAQPIPRIAKNGGMLPLAPILPLMRKDAEAAFQLAADDQFRAMQKNRGIFALAASTGISSRRLQEYLSGRANFITLDLADQYLCATGRHLRDVWPWLYTVEQAAADVDAVENSGELRRLKKNARKNARQARIRAEAQKARATCPSALEHRGRRWPCTRPADHDGKHHSDFGPFK